MTSQGHDAARWGWVLWRENQVGPGLGSETEKTIFANGFKVESKEEGVSKIDSQLLPSAGEVQVGPCYHSQTCGKWIDEDARALLGYH